MENYVVSARKYRPSTFASVVGQKALTVTLKNAIATDRLAHAYLFCGSRGVGKTSCARIFAKTINCTHRTPDGEACNECDSCRSFNENRSLNIIELDAASHNSIDDIRALIEQVMVPPTMGKYRVFIIDEVHMLSTAAFNGFLKTLEEPPEHVIFILATTEKHKIIPTILSRCQIYDFNRISINDMVDHLGYVANTEGIQFEPAALNVIARLADGAMRDALSIFDQVAASSMGHISYQSTIDNLNILDSKYYNRLFEAFLAQDVPTALLIYKEIREKGFDSQFFINGLASYLRDLMVASNPKTLELLEASDDDRKAMAAIAAKCRPDFLYKAMSLCNDADFNYRQASNKQFLIELTLIKLCQLLSPSANSGDAEGRLKPIAAMHQAAAPAKSAPAAASPTKQAPAQPAASSAAVPLSPSISHQPAPSARTQSITPSHHGRISISRPLQTSETKPAAEPSTQPKKLRDFPYTNDIVLTAWDNYISSHPTAQIVINTMRMARPVRPDSKAHEHIITVENDFQRDTMINVMPDLLNYMRNMLNNDHFTLRVEVNKGEAPSYAWNENELLRHLTSEHPELAALVKDFKLTIG